MASPNPRSLSMLAGSTCLLLAMLAADIAIAGPPEGEVEAPVEPEPPHPTSSTVEIDAEELRRLQQRLDALEDEVADLRANQAEQSAPQPPPPKLEPPEQPDEGKDEQGEPAGVTPVGASTDGQRPPDYATGFHFGSYGRVVAGGDLRGRPGRDADIVARGSRWDEQTYAELELRREDYWKETGAYTRIVSTVAFAHPVFHYDTNFDAKLAIRNLYIEEQDLGLKGLSFWAGSRMYRGDDVYVLDWWPLDNLNTIGGGVGYQAKVGTFLKIHAGVMQPNSGFFRQLSPRLPAFDQPGEVAVAILDRQKLITSYKLGHVFGFGESAGIKLIAYGETHHLRPGQREQDYREFEDVPPEHGFVAGGEVSLFSGKRSTHLNLWVRHAWNLAAYGDFNVPTQLGPDDTTKGARELIVALGGNYEVKFFGLMGGAYFRRFRNASPDLDYRDINEGIILLRPQFWIGKFAGVALEGSYQFQQRGVLSGIETGSSPQPLFASLGRVGVMPFLAIAGRGSYARPHIRAMYMLTVRDAGARSLYPIDDVFNQRGLDHFLGLGAEWWFGSTSYFRD
ncbi:MAG: carbohydrate porin [Deltaproteobacteria bacterium]|nr:carbohydrate porin [Deltaproteobacteria bacterium]